MPGDVLGVKKSKVPFSPCTCPSVPDPLPLHPGWCGDTALPCPSGGPCALEAPEFLP